MPVDDRRGADVCVDCTERLRGLARSAGEQETSLLLLASTDVKALAFVTEYFNFQLVTTGDY